MDIPRIPQSIRDAQQRERDRSQANAESRAKIERLAPVYALWANIYISRPHACSDEELERWLDNWSARLAEFGKALVSAGLEENVQKLRGDSLSEDMAADILRVALAGEPKEVLALLRTCPMTGEYTPEGGSRLQRSPTRR